MRSINSFKILANSESSPLKKYIEKIERYGDTVEIEEAVIHHFASLAANSPFGVRSLHQILKSIFREALFLAPEGGKKRHKITLNQIQE